MILSLEHLSQQERAAREHRLNACIDCVAVRGRACECRIDAYTKALWDAICARTEDWSERLALIDGHLCVVVSFGEMMVSKGVFGQRHLETAASVLSEFLVMDQTENPQHRLSRARLLRDRLKDISLGAGEARALGLLTIRIELELELLKGAG